MVAPLSARWNALFLCFEEVVLEDQPALLGPFALRALSHGILSSRSLKKPKIFFPEVHGWNSNNLPCLLLSGLETWGCPQSSYAKIQTKVLRWLLLPYSLIIYTPRKLIRKEKIKYYGYKILIWSDFYICFAWMPPSAVLWKTRKANQEFKLSTTRWHQPIPNRMLRRQIRIKSFNFKISSQT